MKTVFTILIFILSTNITYSQTKGDFRRLLKKSVEELKENEYKGGLNKFKKFYTSIPAAILPELQKYEKDTAVKVRSFVYRLTDRIGKKNTDVSTGQQVVYRLVLACKDDDPGIRTNAALLLKGYKQKEFTKQSKNQLTAYLSSGAAVYKNIVKIIGYIEMYNLISPIKDLLKNDTLLTGMDRWQLHLSLARLGNQEATDYCLNLVRSKGVNDRIIHILFKDLVYTRQPQAIDYLVEILQSEDKNCRSPNPDSRSSIVCGYRVMELLTPVIENFPLEMINGIPQVDTNDYKQALKTARIWFRKNPEYIIKTDKY